MKISIITVCFNSALTIRKTLWSIASQDYKNVEHIIVDGFSSDATIEIVQEFPQLNSIIVSEPDGGVYYAMNKGLSRASGEIIGFLNSDDFYVCKTALSEIVSCFLKDPRLSACYSDLFYVERDNPDVPVRYWRSNIFKRGSFSFGWNPPHPTFFVRRDLYIRLGNFNTRYKVGADIDLMMRFLEVHRIRSLYLPIALVAMRNGGVSNGSLRQIVCQNLEVFDALRLNRLPLNPLLFLFFKFFTRINQFIFKKNLVKYRLDRPERD